MVLEPVRVGFLRRKASMCSFSGTIQHKMAIFREINQGIHWAHHDALEFTDGQIVLLT